MIPALLTSIYILAGPTPDVLVVQTGDVRPLDQCELAAAEQQHISDYTHVSGIQVHGTGPTLPILRAVYKCISLDQLAISEAGHLVYADGKRGP